MEYTTIAVDGRGGSGKSTFSRWLSGKLEGFVRSEGDDYYEPIENDLVPGFFNAERFMFDVGTSLKAGHRSLLYLPYTWPGRTELPHRIVPVDRGVIHEGILAFDLPIDWDVKIWVETPREVALQRYFDRAEELRRSTRTPEQTVIAGLEWARQADEYIARVDPLNTADIVIDGTLPFDQQLV